MTDIVYRKGDTITALYRSRTSADAATESLRSAGVPSDAISITAPNEDADGSYGKVFGSDHEDRASYDEGIRRGGCLVVVSGLDSDLRERAADVLEGTDAVDFDQEESSWRSEGWTGGSAGTAGGAYAGTAGLAEERGDFTGRTDEDSVPVIDEELRVGKRDRSGGRVKVRSYVREEPVSQDVELRDEHVEVERRPVDRPAGAGAFAEKSIEATEHHEEAVVDKQARVTEEVSLRKEGGTHTETVSDTVRHTDVEIDRDDDTTRR